MIPALRVATLILVFCLGCTDKQVLAKPGTIHVEHVGSLDADEWYYHAPADPKIFNDGDEFQQDNTCGYVYQYEGIWKAAAYPDHSHGVRLYHSKEAAMKFVQEWCKP